MLIVVLFGFLNIKSVKMYAIPYILVTTLLLYKLDTLLLKQKNLPVLDITGFFFCYAYAYAPRPSPEYSCGKRNPLYPIRRFFCFNSTVSYTYTSLFRIDNLEVRPFVINDVFGVI